MQDHPGYLATAEMKPIIIKIFFLSFLLSIANAIDCYMCHGRNSETCNATITQCAEGEKCIITSEEFLCNGTYRSVYKGCSRGIPCDWKPYARANIGFSFRVSTKCCNENLCNNGSYEMPEPEKPSGILCPGCFAADSLTGCKSEKDIVCRGKNDKCHISHSTVQKPDGDIVRFSFEGCISPALCNTDLSQLVGPRVLNSTVFECTEPAKPLCEEEKDN